MPNTKSSFFPPMEQSSKSSSKSFIEHIVLFKVNQSTPSTVVATTFDQLRSLSTLAIPTFLTAGPILPSKSNSSHHFTHFLHARFDSKQDLAAYIDHPRHVAVVRDYPIFEDILAVDWVSDVEAMEDLDVGEVVRVVLAKEKGDLMGICGLGFVGQDFSIRRNKGFNFGFVKKTRNCDDAGIEDDLLKEGKVILIDYLVPPACI